MDLEPRPGTTVAENSRPAATAAPAAASSSHPASQRPHFSQEELQWWADQGGGSSEDYSSEDEAALGLETAPPDFYDPRADAKDEAWAVKLRQGRKSDAVLSCPACLTTVCIDCQQHAVQEGQFRAAFVMNCRVETKRIVRPRASASGKRRRKQDDDSQPADAAAADEDKFHPVLCAACGQEMGVWGVADQIYHFFHVVPTNA